MKASMSRKGNCYDNTPMESFWGTLKTELIYSQEKYQTRREAELSISDDIEVFYNRQRIQKKLGYISPIAFERNY
jgi:putative transposase